MSNLSLIDPLIIILRFSLLAVLYLFIFALYRLIIKDIRYSKNNSGDFVVKYKLVVRDNGNIPELHPGAEFPVEAPTVIGRDINNELVVPDPHISAQHAKLSNSRNYLILEDLGSTNGTYVNRVRIKGKKKLRVGDMVRLGDVTFEVLRWENENSGSL